jgi:hypothetical protein
VSDTVTPATEPITLTPTPISEVPTAVLLPSPTPTELPTVPPIPPNVERYEDRGTPVSLLASYFNAINRQEYQRAWDYWEQPPTPSYEGFTQGYDETMSVFLAVSPPTFIEGAAGSQYARVPTLMITTHVDGSQHVFAGCYVTRRVNPGTEGVDEGWSLYDAAVNATPGNTTDVTLLTQACEVWR